MNTRFIHLLSRVSLSICLLSGCSNTMLPLSANSTKEPVALARQITLAKQLYKDGLYKKAFNILKPLAEQGNAQSQYHIGYMYYYGQGINKNESLGMAWINKSSQQGHKKAITAIKILAKNKTPTLSTQLIDQVKTTEKLAQVKSTKQKTNQKISKKSIKQEIEKAKNYYSKRKYLQTFTTLKPLAEQGNAEAQYSLGYLYLYGEGVSENKKHAISWINKAANQGHADAINAIKILTPKSHPINIAQTPRKENHATNQLLNNKVPKPKHAVNNQTKHYGPVQAEDTLWSIAKKTRPNTNVSIHQMMQALYQNNPTAFNNKKLNSLKLGSLLSIPNESLIKKLNNSSTQHN